MLAGDWGLGTQWSLGTPACVPSTPHGSWHTQSTHVKWVMWSRNQFNRLKMLNWITVFSSCQQAVFLSGAVCWDRETEFLPQSQHNIVCPWLQWTLGFLICFMVGAGAGMWSLCFCSDTKARKTTKTSLVGGVPPTPLWEGGGACHPDVCWFISVACGQTLHASCSLPLLSARGWGCDMILCRLGMGVKLKEWQKHSDHWGHWS